MLTKRRAAFCTAVIAFSVLAASCGGAQSRLASHMQRGQTYYSNGNYAKAGIEFRNALQIAPKDTTAQLMVARVAEHLGQVRAAAGLYQAVIDSSPGNIEARVGLGRLLVLGGQSEHAVQILDPGLNQHPDDAGLLTWRAAAKMRLNDMTGALADADRALQLAPTNEDAISLRAGLYQQSGNIPAAVDLVSTAVSKLPATVDLREVLVNLYVVGNEPVKAEEQLHALIKLRPEELRYRNELAVFYSREHKLDEAQLVLEDAVKSHPRSDEAKLTLVSFLTSQRGKAQGEQALQAFVTANPDDHDLRLGLGELLERSGKPKEALAAYQEVIRRAGTEPKGLIARNRIAADAVAQGRYDDARKFVDEVLQKNPRDTDALALRGQIALAHNDPPAAIADFRAVIKDQPRAVGIQQFLAQAFIANGEPALAEESLHAAIESSPADTSLRLELAKLMLQTQRSEQAVPLLEEAVRKAPTDVAARVELARAYLLKRDFVAANTAAEALKTLHPDLAAGWYFAGLAAQSQNRLDDAQKEFEHALTLQPGAFDALSSLARLQLARGRVAEAIAVAKNETERDPKGVAAFNLLGELYLAEKNLPLADEALTHATTLAPTWWIPYRNLAMAKYAAKDEAGAIAAYQAGIKVAPSEPRLVTELALLYEERGRIDDAISSYDAWNRKNPRVQIVANNLAMLLVTHRKDRSSLDRARDLTAAFPESSSATLLDTKGWVHFKRAEYSDALSILQVASTRDPDSKEIRYHLGMAELQAGQKDRARSDLEAALAGAAKFSGSDEARTVLTALKSTAG